MHLTLAEAYTSVAANNDNDSYRFGNLIGRSPAMRELLAKLRQVAPSHVAILLQGETGTGKEVVVEELHRHSGRREAPFVVVDCAAMPESLIESELFGHVRGAFTGALEHRKGAFERAHGGTIFLDEIGELSLSMQSRLLRVLESCVIRRVGGNDDIDVDVRVIAATHRDLRAAVRRGKFRPDLYYRLAVVRLTVPPLRERGEDLADLCEVLLDEIVSAQRRPRPQLSAEVMDWIKSYGWPGNVRELRNCLERYAVLWPKVRDWGSFSEADVMPSNGALGCTADTQDQDVEIFREAKSVAVAQFERAYCRRLLEASKHNISEAARRASMSRSHLWRMLVRHGFTESHRHHATDAVTAKCIEDQEFEPDNE